jgi:hypothetical protein
MQSTLPWPSLSLLGPPRELRVCEWHVMAAGMAHHRFASAEPQLSILTARLNSERKTDHRDGRSDPGHERTFVSQLRSIQGQVRAVEF